MKKLMIERIRLIMGLIALKKFTWDYICVGHNKKYIVCSYLGKGQNIQTTKGFEFHFKYGKLFYYENHVLPAPRR